MRLRDGLFSMVLALAIAAPGSAQQATPPAGGQSERDQDRILVTGERDRARAQWVRAESPNFTVYGLDEANTREMASRLERFDQLLRLVTHIQAPVTANPLPVYLVLGATSIARLRRQRARSGFYFTGYYSAAPTGVVLATDIGLDNRMSRIPRFSDMWLFTEYSRHFLIQNARGTYLPTWYIDGLSLTLATTFFDGDKIEYGKAHPGLAARLKYLRWEPIRRIISGDLDNGQEYSAESALLVHYILADPARNEAFARFIADMRAGAQPVPAFEKAFGTSMGQLHNRLWRYRNESTYIRATATGFAVPDITISRMPRSADALLLDQAAMRIGIIEPDRQQEVLARARKAVADRNDVFAMRVLAQAELLYGTPGNADAQLAALLAAAPTDPELLYLKGLRYLVAGRVRENDAPAMFREARRWFASAYRADPEYYPALYAWVESLSTEPRFVSDEARNALLKAAYLAPQATQIQVSAALMQMVDGQFEAAKALLAPIILSPRNPASEQVPALLAQVRARQPATRAQLLGSFRTVAVWKDLNCC